MPLADPEAPATVYLVYHPEYDCLKIGVTAAGRIEEHEELGWWVLNTWWFPLGYDAMEIEELVLDRWRNLYSQRAAIPQALMPQGGASETVRDTVATRADTVEFVWALHTERCDRSVGCDDSDPYDDDLWAGSDWADER